MTRARVTLILACTAAVVSAQAASVRVEADRLHLSAPAFHFIKGRPLTRLRDGRAVRFDLDLRVLARPGGAVVAQSREGCLVSYDLWEERFAVAAETSPSRLVSNLTAPDAEAWCLDRLAVPVTALRGRLEAFFVRLEYRVVDDEVSFRPEDSGATLRGLIDRLSRRSADGDRAETVELGPFRLPD
jgi:hypothetical protein